MQNTTTSTAISVRIMGPAHCLICVIIMQKSRHLFDDELRVSTDQTHGTRFNRFRAFSRFTHHKHRLAEGRCFLLNAAGIGED